MHNTYKVLRRKVKYIRLEIKDGELFVTMPVRSKVNTDEVIKKHEKWIKRKIKLVNEIKELSRSYQLYNHKNLGEVVKRYIDQMSQVLKTKPKSVNFRKMKRRWGSCSSDGRLLFNKLLMYLPLDLIKYVVVHEMCHLIVKNHRKEFWQLVKRFCPDYLEKEKILSAFKMKIEELSYRF